MIIAPIEKPLRIFESKDLNFLSISNTYLNYLAVAMSLKSMFAYYPFFQAVNDDY